MITSTNTSFNRKFSRLPRPLGRAKVGMLMFLSISVFITLCRGTDSPPPRIPQLQELELPALPWSSEQCTQILRRNIDAANVIFQRFLPMPETLERIQKFAEADPPSRRRFEQAMDSCARGRGGRPGDGFLYKMTKGDQTHYLVGMVHAEGEHYKRYLRQPLLDIIRRSHESKQPIRTLYVECKPTAENTPYLFDATNNMELLMMSDCRPYGVSCVGLETYEENTEASLRAYGKIQPSDTEKEVANKVRACVDKIKKRGKFNRAVPNEIYRDGKEQSVFVANVMGMSQDPAVQDWVYRRNTSWLNKVGHFNGRPASIIAVGAAHLYGSGGVVELLRANHWTV